MPQSVQEFLTWKALQEAEVKSREEELVDRLLSAVPYKLAVWMSQTAELIVRDIIRYGHADRKYRSHELDNYGFTSLEDCEANLRLLVSSWTDVEMTVTLWEGDQTVTVLFDIKEK